MFTLLLTGNPEILMIAGAIGFCLIFVSPVMIWEATRISDKSGIKFGYNLFKIGSGLILVTEITLVILIVLAFLEALNLLIKSQKILNS